MKAKKTNPIFWVFFLSIVIVVAVYATGDSNPTPKKIAKKTSPKTTTSVLPAEFNEEDEKATFEPISEPPKDTFKPIIARRSAGIGGADGKANIVPPEYAGGVAGWVYTGNAEVDGVPTALLENRSTQDGVFLKQGDRWQSSVVESINPTSLVLNGPTGEITLALVNEESSSGSGSSQANMNGGFNGLNGNIGPFDPMNMGGGDFNIDDGGGAVSGGNSGRGGNGNNRGRFNRGNRGNRGGGNRGGGNRVGGGGGRATGQSTVSAPAATSVATVEIKGGK